jgi:hypothetical protein
MGGLDWVKEAEKRGLGVQIANTRDATAAAAAGVALRGKVPVVIEDLSPVARCVAGVEGEAPGLAALEWGTAMLLGKVEQGLLVVRGRASERARGRGAAPSPLQTGRRRRSAATARAAGGGPRP